MLHGWTNLGCVKVHYQNLPNTLPIKGGWAGQYYLPDSVSNIEQRLTFTFKVRFAIIVLFYFTDVVYGSEILRKSQDASLQVPTFMVEWTCSGDSSRKEHINRVLVNKY